jgi:hypothetical protein
MGRHEDELLLTPRQLLINRVALRLERLAEPHQGHVQTALQHRFGGTHDLVTGLLICADLLEHLPRRIAPAQRPLGDLIQRRRALDRKLAEDRGRLAPHVAG